MADQHFSAHGKLLLTAEYAVLKGATALALPTKLKQHLHIAAGGTNNLIWQAFDVDGALWLAAEIAPDFSIVSTTDPIIAGALVNLLQEATKLNPQFIPWGVTARTQLDFNRKWGLGTSSTVVALLAQWAKIDAFTLFFASQKGSGYDVACALSAKPLLYQLNEGGQPHVKATTFHPAFAHELCFIYLGKKQTSETEVIRFDKHAVTLQQLAEVTELTNQISTAGDLLTFEKLLADHEKCIGVMLGKQPIQAELFSDYPGVVKSLGAWGGDFVLATRTSIAKRYFQEKGFKVLLQWDDMFDY